MNRTASLALSLLLPAAVFAACKEEEEAEGAQRLEVSITSEGCEPASVEARPGTITFVVTNENAASVTEYEVLKDDRILGEIENISQGLTGRFTVNLEAGEYVTYCPGGKSTERGKLTVAGDPVAVSGDGDPDFDAAVTTYRAFVEDNASLLIDAAEELRDAIEDGDRETARAKYIAARPYYERIEPVAEAFGDLDPAIDARADDVPIEQVTGFHRIEYGLWETGSTEGLLPIAEQLVTDVTRLHDDAPKLEIDAFQIANGANELLGEVSASKITGEEERYSHIDLLDFQANLEGSRAAFNAVRAALDKRNQSLAVTVDERFAAVQSALDAYRTGDTFALYTDLSADDTRQLSQLIDALAEPLSEVASELAKQPTG